MPKAASPALSVYRSKRDFSVTPEPQGGKTSSRAGKQHYPRFVIQKHDATRLHYDLRLEVGGTFKSWAVTRGPSADPADKRLAVEVEDHPLEYGDFEGSIPEGEYGGGTVMIWDRGFWSPEGTASPAAALSRGELKFTIAGEKMQGSYVLVRMKHDRDKGKRTNWLLIKHRDEWAKPGAGDSLLKKDRSVASGRTMREIAAGKGDPPARFMMGGASRMPADAVWHSEPQPKAPAARAAARKSVAQKIEPVNAGGGTVLGLKISNPAKELWPAQKREPAVTKLEFVAYLATVAPWMLAHIAGRPCSLVRAPDGIGGNVFFQRHALSKPPRFVHEVAVPGDKERYLQVDDAEGIVEMGQLAALEFHPWNSAPGHPDRPGRLVFDLDPGDGLPFAAVVDAANELRQRLERLGLETFCKTTGGKGLHVVTPLKPETGKPLDWHVAKTFAQTLSAQMAEDSPDRYLVNMAKRRRKGRIFIDYLRNDIAATAVAPLSPRARPGATVSMPLNWPQVRRDLDPARFTIRTAPALIAKSKPWNDYAAAARPLSAAVAKLVKSA